MPIPNAVAITLMAQATPNGNFTAMQRNESLSIKRSNSPLSEILFIKSSSLDARDYI